MQRSECDVPDGDDLGGRVLRFAFHVYKLVLSPILHTVSPSRCLYLPTCSEYAYVAISRFGWVRGSWLALCRLSRCHPWGKGGLDLVPDRVRPCRPSCKPLREQPDYSGEVQAGSNRTATDQTPPDRLP